MEKKRVFFKLGILILIFVIFISCLIYNINYQKSYKPIDCYANSLLEIPTIIINTNSPSNTNNDNNTVVGDTIYYSISEEDRYIIEHLVAGEAGHESFLGKMAVAQCILNAMKKENLNINEVRIKYQYTGWSPENFEYNFPEEWNDVCYAVTCVFDYGLKITEENILWFYSPQWMENGISKWHESQKFVIEIGGHRFFAPLD